MCSSGLESTHLPSRGSGTSIQAIVPREMGTLMCCSGCGTNRSNAIGTTQLLRQLKEDTCMSYNGCGRRFHLIIGVAQFVFMLQKEIT